MIPAPFDYIAPITMGEALEILARSGEDAKILAGGHSLLPLMKLRLAQPSVLIDIGRVSSLRYIRDDNGWLEIGAMTPYAELERSQLIRDRAPVLAQAASLVGDAQVRHRGTIGGSLAHADPAGDLPAVIVALSGVIRVQSPTGIRDVAAGEFFVGIFETVLEPDEIVVAIRLAPMPRRAQHYQKFRRRACDWAIVGSAVTVELDRDDDNASHIRSAKIVLTNVGPVPATASALEQALIGCAVDEGSLRHACDVASEGLDPTPELNGSSEYKKHLARVVTRRALIAAIEGTGSPRS